MAKPSIAMIGAGRLGSALAKQLARSGYRVREIVSRRNSQPARRLASQVQARPSTLASARLDVDVVWFCVPDSAIADCAANLTERNWRQKVAFHSSGVLASDVLTVLAVQGAKVGSVHPLMTFVRDASPDLKGVAFALEGDPQAVELASTMVRNLGGRVLHLKSSDKVAYHAFATIICPLFISLLATAEAVVKRAGLRGTKARRLALPILEETLRNYRILGPARSFTGPIARGDLDTVRQHLEILTKAPTASDVYVALARGALQYLPSSNRRKLERLLKEVSREPAARSLRGKDPARRRAIHRG